MNSRESDYPPAVAFLCVLQRYLKKLAAQWNLSKEAPAFLNKPG